MHGHLTKRTILVYSVLWVLCLAVVAWQVAEHYFLRQVARQGLVHRARDITSTLGIVLRSQRGFGGVVFKERLEQALRDLIRPGELSSIVVLSSTGEAVAAAGDPIDLTMDVLEGPGVYWGNRTLTLMNLIDLGTNVTTAIEGDSPSPTIILPRELMPPGFPTNRSSFRSRGDRRSRDHDNSTNATDALSDQKNRGEESFDGPSSPRRGGGWRRPPFGRPPWMTEDEYQTIIQKQGVHSFLIALSTQSVRLAARRDLWLRVALCLMATLSAAGGTLAWRNLQSSSELQIRLVKASQMNTHLKEMNLAAAGLAHETRNPLNLIRGMAQMISRQQDTPLDVRDRSVAIVEEADRVTAQLNEFINYSRAREVRRGPVALTRLMGEVVRALTVDTEAKAVRVTVPNEDVVVEADDQLLRQALFNLIINAIQALDPGGEIELALVHTAPSEIQVEIRDNGPGVPAHQRSEIFKPYVTMQKNGTGLGLAIVQQIVLAHGWEIDCDAREPRGAVFRMRHLKVVAPASKKP